MKRTIFATVLSMAMAATGFAQMGGGGMGGGTGGGGMGGGDMGDGNGNGGMHGGNTGGTGGIGTGGMGPNGMGGGMGGGGMFGVADDASLLFVDGHNPMQWSDDEDAPSELVNISTDGQERWRVSFENGQPMMIVSAGDLVVVSVPYGGEQGDQADDWYGGMGGGSSVLVGLDLVSGVQLWTFELEQASMTRAQLSEDGSMVYVMATDGTDEMGTGSMHQGDGGFNRNMTSTLYALNRFGDLLWTLDLNNN